VHVSCKITLVSNMSHKIIWKILNWNIRGINSENKWNALASKIEESNCDIICIQKLKGNILMGSTSRNFVTRNSMSFFFYL
jgi:exonuclease III